MSPVVVILPEKKPNMLSAGLPAAADGVASLPPLRTRAFFGEEPVFFAALVFLGFAILY